MPHSRALALLLLLPTLVHAQPAPIPAKAPNPYAERIPLVRRALKPLLVEASTSHEKIMGDWITLASTPSPSGKEQARAAKLAAILRAAGLEAKQDKAGNLVALLKGTGKPGRKKLVVFAHMDSVFGPEVPIKVTREKAILRGPGVGDDASGCTALAWTARMIQQFGLRFDRDVWLVGSAREELGLLGAQAFFAEHHESIEAAISIDGGFGGISYGALGIHWYELRFKGPGSHTLSSMGKPAPTRAVAETIAAIYQLKVPRKPRMKKTWFNVGKMGGGAVVNAQPKEAWFTVDLRSMDGPELARLEQRVFSIARSIATSTRTELTITPIQKFPAAQVPGMREHKLVRAAEAAIGSITGRSVWVSPSGASDHCVAIARGMPGIGIGCGKWHGAHTTEEWVDTSDAPKAVQQVVLLLSLYAELSRVGGKPIDWKALAAAEKKAKQPEKKQ